LVKGKKESPTGSRESAKESYGKVEPCRRRLRKLKRLSSVGTSWLHAHAHAHAHAHVLLLVRMREAVVVMSPKARRLTTVVLKLPSLIRFY